LFQRQTLVYHEIDKWGWNGRPIYNSFIVGPIYKRRFKYGMCVVSDEHKKGGGYPSQAGKNDKLGKSVPPYE
jgi:hypothetical protein